MTAARLPFRPQLLRPPRNCDLTMMTAKPIAAFSGRSISPPTQSLNVCVSDFESPSPRRYIPRGLTVMPSRGHDRIRRSRRGDAPPIIYHQPVWKSVPRSPCDRGSADPKRLYVLKEPYGAYKRLGSADEVILLAWWWCRFRHGWGCFGMNFPCCCVQSVWRGRCSG